MAIEEVEESFSLLLEGREPVAKTKSPEVLQVPNFTQKKKFCLEERGGKLVLCEGPSVANVGELLSKYLTLSLRKDDEVEITATIISRVVVERKTVG